MKSFRLLLLCLSFVSVERVLWSQANLGKTAPTTLVEDTSKPNKSSKDYSLKLKWNEVHRVFNVDLENAESKPLVIWGVQTTPGLYVADFPQNIPPQKSGSFAFLYFARGNSDGTADLISIMTDRGERLIKIAHDREQALQFDATELEWKQDDPLTPKSMTFSLAANTAVAKQARVIGGGSATLTSLGSGRYRVTVTPPSTAKVQQFPVSIMIEPTLPGVAAVINCAVVSAAK